MTLESQLKNQALEMIEKQRKQVEKLFDEHQATLQEY